MATYCASVLISELRKQKGFSQEKLAEGICDRRTISYIENGSISPSKYVFERLMQRLGVDPQRFSSYISSKAEMHFDEARNKISQLFREEKENEILDILDSMEKDKLLNKNKFVIQYILKTRAWIVAGGMDWNNASDSELPTLLDKAIGLTIESFDPTNIKNELYTVIEIDLIRMYGIWKLFTGRKEEALPIFQALEALINTGYIYVQDIARVYTTLLTSLAKCHRWLKNYEEALLASERGLKVCIDSQEYRSLPWLLYQKASALYWLGNMEQSLKVLNEAIIISKNYAETEMTGFLQKRMQDMKSGDF